MELSGCRDALVVVVISLAVACSEAKPVGTRLIGAAQHRVTNDEDVESLGSRLFEDSTLSLDSSLSCATCHRPDYAFAEPKAVSHGIGSRAQRRNAPTLLNVSLRGSPFDWDGRANTLEAQLSGVFSVDGDMGISLEDAVHRLQADSSYRRAFRMTLGQLPSKASLAMALVAFTTSLRDGGAPFDRFYLGGDPTAMSAQERRGWKVFRDPRSGCAGCHVPVPDPATGLIMFTDDRFHNLGIGYDAGRMSDLGHFEVTHRGYDRGAFRTPSLRNVALTAPYMHDGSLATLEDVVDFYANGGIANPRLDVVMAPRTFTRQQRSDLIAFLGALTADQAHDK